MESEALAQMLSTYLMSPQGGGPGLWGDSFREQLKALGSVDKSMIKANEALAPPSGEAPGTTPMMPVANAGGGPTGWDSFKTAMNTPTGAAGLANMLGQFGAAISGPNTWQSRLGTASAGMGQNVIAADRFGQIMSGLRPPVAPPAPTIATPPPVGGAPGATSNFLQGVVSNPPQQASEWKLPLIQDVWLGK